MYVLSEKRRSDTNWSKGRVIWTIRLASAVRVMFAASEESERGDAEGESEASERRGTAAGSAPTCSRELASGEELTLGKRAD